MSGILLIYSSIELLRVWFGVSILFNKAVLVIGLKLLFTNHIAIASLSYECPSLRETGSFMISRVNGQRKLLGTFEIENVLYRTRSGASTIGVS